MGGDKFVQQCDVVLVEGLEEHEQSERASALEQRCSVRPGEHPQDDEHAAGAGRTRLVERYGSTRKSLRSAGTAWGLSTCAAALKCASVPSKRLGSVSTETAAAPARA